MDSYHNLHLSPGKSVFLGQDAQFQWKCSYRNLVLDQSKFYLDLVLDSCQTSPG